MKFAAALIAMAGVTSAITTSATGDIGSFPRPSSWTPATKPVPTYDPSSVKPAPYDGYFNVNGYQPHRYGSEYPSNLPTPDFNCQVFDFDENEEFWDQEDYECRIRMEAEMLVALEQLKGAVATISWDVEYLESWLEEQGYECDDVDGNNGELNDDCETNEVCTRNVENALWLLTNACRNAQRDLDENKAALVLYCQQFAFAPDMVGPCAELLTCRDTELEYAYPFIGSGRDAWAQSAINWHSDADLCPEDGGAGAGHGTGS